MDQDLTDDAAVAQRAHERHVGAAGTVGILPRAGVAVAARRSQGAVEEALHLPGCAADSLAARGVTKAALVLQVVDRAHGDHADPERIVPALGTLGVVLADHDAAPAVGVSDETGASALAGCVRLSSTRMKSS